MTFAQAQAQVRWHHQYVVVNDFLPRLVGQDLVTSLLDVKPNGNAKSRGTLYKPGNPLRPMMPIEYSVAAYRFGHSMIRGRVRGPRPAHAADLRAAGPRPPRLAAVPAGSPDRLELLLRAAGGPAAGRPQHRPADRHAAVDAAGRAAAHRRGAGRRRDHRARRAQPAARQDARSALGPGRRRRRWGSPRSPTRDLGLTDAALGRRRAAVVLHPQGVRAAGRRSSSGRSAGGSSPR